MATATRETEARTLPRAIRRGLRRVGRRLRTFGLLRGLGTLGLVLVVGAVVGVAADLALVLPPTARWGLWLAWVGAAAATLGLSIVRPLVRRPNWDELAALAEQGGASPGERLTSSVELLGGRGHGSRALIDVLAEQAAERAEQVDPAEAVPMGPARRRLAYGALAVGLVLLPALVRPDPFAALLSRFAAPWREVDRVGRWLVDVRPGDRVVAVGSDVPFTAAVRPRYGSADAPEAAWLEWTGADGKARRVAMTAESLDPSPSRSFAATLPRVEGSFTYRIVSGSATSRRHTIKAVEPPAVASIVATVEPPAYTKWPTAQAADPARVEALEGSRITLRVATNKPVKRISLDWPRPAAKDGAPASRSVALASDGGAWTATLDAIASGPYVLELWDEYELKNRAEPPRRVVVRPDGPPTLALGGSDEAHAAKPNDVLLVPLASRDDVAVASVELHYAIARAGSAAAAELGKVAAKVPGLGTRSAKGEAALALGTLDLHAGDALTYRVRVADNRPGPAGPNVVWSSGRALTINDQAEPLAAARDAAERADFQARLDAIKKANAANRKQAETLRYAADAAGRGNGRWDDDKTRELAAREADARAVVDQLQALARDFGGSARFAPLETPTREVAEVEAEGSRDALERAARADDDGRRLDQLKQADNRLAATQTRLDELQKKFDELARADDDRRRLRVLAERQEALAARAEQLAREGGDPAERERIRQEQEAIRRETDELLKKSPELRAEALAAQAQRAQDLAERARDLARRQDEESRRTADPDDRRDAALRELAEAQRQLEADARRLAMQVDAPLQEEGRGRLNLDALRQPIEPIARGEVEQGRQRLENAESELRRLARDLEDVRDDPKSLARRLVRRQDQLRERAAQAARDVGQIKTPEDRARLAERLKPLVEQEAAIAQLAAAIPVEPPQRDARRNAAEAVNQARDQLREPQDPNQTAQRLNNARDRLDQFANALPDANQRRERARQQAADAHRKTNDVARDLERHLRETAPRKDLPPEVAAAQLAERVAPLARVQEEAAAQLAALAVEERAGPQLERAARRAQAVADLLDAIRDAAPTPADAEARRAEPPADWHLIGPFDLRAAAPFPVAGPIDLKAVHDGRNKVHATWRPARSGDRGLIDLGAIYNRGDNQSAFGYAEIHSPAAGRGQLVVGSDDTLTVWLNGKVVYDFQGNRPIDQEQAKLDVELDEGINRLVIRCGNGNGEWKFAVALRPPPTGAPAGRLAQIADLRRAATPAARDAQAAADRLEQTLQDRPPADDLAAELANDLKQLQSHPDHPDAAAEARRVATALRNLDTPDAPSPREEAVRLAERAARQLEQGGNEAAKATADAAQAAEDLAERLADAATPAEQAAALARAERALAEPDAGRDPAARARTQHAIADDLARLGIEPAEAGQPDEAQHAAAEAVDRAANLADRASRQRAEPEALADARRAAAEALDRLAAAQPAPAEVAQPAAPPEPAANPRERARALAGRQRELAGELQAARERFDQAPEPQKVEARQQLNEQIAKAIDRQHELAEAARALPTDQADAERPDAAQAAARDREQTRLAQRHAGEALARRDPGQAADAARNAAETLDRLAADLPERAQAAPAMPADPDLGVEPAQADAARDFARRERQIRERLQSLLADRVAPQEHLRDESRALGREVADLRDQSRDLSPRSQGPANNAAGLLQDQAPQAMTQGADALAQGRPDAARDQQRRAADLVENAARAVEDLVAALRTDQPGDGQVANNGAGEANGEGEGEGEGEGQPDLGQARAAQQEASNQLAQDGGEQGGRSSAESASRSMRQAAQGLRAASQRGRSQDGQVAAAEPPDGDPQNSTRDPQSAPGGKAAASLAELQELIRSKTGRKWGELPGHLRTEILQMSQGRYRDDYARLIQLYFREIAAPEAPR